VENLKINAPVEKKELTQANINWGWSDER